MYIYMIYEIWMLLTIINIYSTFWQLFLNNLDDDMMCIFNQRKDPCSNWRQLLIYRRTSVGPELSHIPEIKFHYCWSGERFGDIRPLCLLAIFTFYGGQRAIILITLTKIYQPWLFVSWHFIFKLRFWIWDSPSTVPSFI